jgi:hypothetical protein
MGPQRLTRSAALGATLAALALPATAAAAAQDLRSADARERGPAARAVDDLRSPDSRVIQGGVSSSDLRAPDTRDAADGRGTFNAPDVMVVRLRDSAAAAPVTAEEGIDWGDAGIGAAGLLGLAALSLGGAFTLVHRRRGGPAVSSG